MRNAKDMSDPAKATYNLQVSLIEWRDSFTGSEEEVPPFDPSEDASRLKTLQDLCDLGADLDEVEARGTPCIPHVFWSPRLIQFFLDRGRNVNSRDQDGSTALHLAPRYTSLELTFKAIDLLLANSADPNIVDNYGESVIFNLFVFDELRWK